MVICLVLSCMCCWFGFWDRSASVSRVRFSAFMNLVARLKCILVLCCFCFDMVVYLEFLWCLLLLWI